VSCAAAKQFVVGYEEWRSNAGMGASEAVHHAADGCVPAKAAKRAGLRTVSPLTSPVRASSAGDASAGDTDLFSGFGVLPSPALGAVPKASVLTHGGNNSHAGAAVSAMQRAEQSLSHSASALPRLTQGQRRAA
jgi:hypothetical protein